MHKYIVLVILISFLVLNFNSIAIAKTNIEINNGVTYNNFVYSNIDNGKNYKDYWVREALNKGIGFYTEGTYWLNEKIGLGAGFEMTKASWDSLEIYDDGSTRDFKSTYKLSDSYGKISYQLDDTIALNVGLTSSQFREHYFADYSWTKEDFNEDIIKGNGLGFLIGAQFDYPLTTNLSFMGNAGYKEVNINLIEKYNGDQESLVKTETNKVFKISTLQVGTSINYKF